MNSFKKALIAIDINDKSDHVLKRAAELVKSMKISIVTLYVNSTDIPAYGGYLGEGFYMPNDLSYDEDVIRKKSIDDISILLSGEKLPTDRVLVEFGSPADTIIDVAKNENVDLIIMGSHGKHGIDLLLGSTATSVLHKSTCDVLAVRIPKDDE